MKKLKLEIKYFFLSFSLLLMLIPNVSSGKERNLLSGKISKESLEKILIPQNQWKPFVITPEDGIWNKLPESLRNKFLADGENELKFKWPSLLLSTYLDYKRIGNRSNYDRQHSERLNVLQNLVIAECISDDGKFLDQIINGIWLICEETTWVGPAHLGGLQTSGDIPNDLEPVVDLTAAETGNLLAWTYYLLSDELNKVSPLITQRIKYEVKRRIITPNFEREDFWWMWAKEPVKGNHHINNWTPWICSNWLSSVLLIEEDENIRISSVYKIMQILDRFINYYPDDGGCDEGPSYWNRAGGSLFDCLELLYSSTNGKINIYDNALIQEIGRFIYKAYINDRYFVNFGDASAKIDVAADLILRFALRTNDSELAGFGALMAERQNIYQEGGGGNITRQLYFLDNIEITRKQKPRNIFLKNVYLPESQMMSARSGDSDNTGLFLSARGGHNEESHNHNDVGSFVIYSDGNPVIIDLGVESYSAKTFSAERYDIWTMQSAYHNLPTINDCQQANGRKFAAKNPFYEASEDSVVFSLDITDAYPEKTGIKYLKRVFVFNEKKQSVSLSDKFKFNSIGGKVISNFMTPCIPEIVKPGLIILKHKNAERTPAVYLHYDPKQINPEMENIVITDRNLKSNWGESVYRLLLKSAPAEIEGEIKFVFNKSE